ncbi:unnamed protein product, partial [Fusarium equiseti]
SIQGVYGRALSEPTQSSHLADYGRPLRTIHIVESPDFRNMAKRDETDILTAAIICGAVLDKKLENWELYFRCFERDQALNTQLCDDVCQSNPLNLCYTNSSAPYCKTYAYPKGIQDYICAATRALQSVYFTVDTERAAQFITATVPVTVEQPATETGTSNTFIETDTEPVTTTIPEPSKSITPSPFPSSKPDSNLGAIIGGAVGGFVALLLIVLAIFWFVRRLKSDDTPGSIKTNEMSGEPATSQA